MCVLDDEETQKKGCLAIVYSVAGEFINGKTDMRTVSAGPWCLRSLPFRACAIHQCFRDPAYRSILQFSLRFFPAKDRARIKIHFGSNVECVYSLMTYGISPEPMPVTSDGELKRKNHTDWIKIRRQQEEQYKGSPRIVVPSQKDVLFGRGKPFREHFGNLRLHNLLEEKLDEYNSSTIKEKTKLIADIVDTIHAEGGRFLKQDRGPWFQVDEKQAREKVSHGFRTRMKIAISSKGAPRGPSSAITRRLVNYSSEGESIGTNSPLSSPAASPLLSFDDHAAFASFPPENTVSSLEYIPEEVPNTTNIKRARYDNSFEHGSS